MSLSLRYDYTRTGSNIQLAVNDYITSLYTTLENLSQTNNGAAIQKAATVAPGGIPITFNSQKPFSVDQVLISLLLKQTNNEALINSTNVPLVDYIQNHLSTTTYDQSTSVAELTGAITYSLSSALQFIMTDMPTFIKFVDNGAFSTMILPKVADLVKLIGA